MKKTLSVQLHEVRIQLATAQEQLTKLTAELKSANAAKDTWYKSSQTEQARVEQLHLIFDCLPAAPPREIERQYGSTVLDPAVRLAVFLAGREWVR